MKSERRKIRIALIFAVIFATLAFVSVECASAVTHYVNPGESIQAAVDTANPTDTIIVRDGIYTENVNVNKHLAIESENGSANCIVQAANPDDHVFEVTADYVNISGFTIVGATETNRYGIYLYRVDYCNVSNNNCSNNFEGIRLYKSNSNVISNNNCSNNEDGIHIGSSNSNSITNNNICSNRWDGIHLHLHNSNSNTITSNTVSNNRYGIYFVHTWEGNNNVIYLNNFINNHYNVNSHGLTNIWNSTSKITYTYNGSTYTNYLGNYWDDYKGSDADKDGIGDTPYSVDSDKDNYPLMEPFENYFKPVCGDVNCDGKVTMSDVRKVFNRYLDPNYPLDSPWAADVNCDNKITMSDVRKVFNRYIDPGYELNCCREGGK